MSTVTTKPGRAPRGNSRQWLTAAVHRPVTELRIPAPGDTGDGEDLLPGFQLPVRALFRDARQQQRGQNPGPGERLEGEDMNPGDRIRVRRLPSE